MFLDPVAFFHSTRRLGFLVPVNTNTLIVEDRMYEQLKHNVFPIVFTVISFMLLMPSMALSHCQIPCGIYDDYARVESMLEDAATMEKSVK